MNAPSFEDLPMLMAACLPLASPVASGDGTAKIWRFDIAPMFVSPPEGRLDPQQLAEFEAYFNFGDGILSRRFIPWQPRPSPRRAARRAHRKRCARRR